jgi:DNA-3-methyladenine glycosylase II
MKKLVTKYHGYRIIGLPALYESISWAITGQQINLSFAYTLKQRFIETFGDHMMHDGIIHYLFPRPEVIAALDPDKLLALQFSKQKATYLLNIARAFVEGVLSREKIAGLPFQEAREELQKIKGVGNWTANYALMKTFHYPNAFPLEDAGLHNAIRNLHKLESKPSIDEVKDIFKQFTGWEAYATLYYWKSLS